MEVNRSRFICSIAHCDSPTAVKQFIDSIRQRYPDASHHCYAFIHARPEISTAYGFSDDGEPTGTAGKPMLAVLQGSDIGEICAVVTRYFGGVKLGTGGLQRAYGNSVRQAILELETTLKTPTDIVTMDIGYEQLNDVEHTLKSFDGKIVASDYGATIHLQLEIAIPQINDFCLRIQEISAGKIIPHNPLTN